MSISWKVVVGAPVPEGALAPLQGVARCDVLPESADRAAVLAAVAGAHGFISMLTHAVDDALLAAAPGLRVVANYAVGYNNVDLEAARRRGLWVCNTPDVLTDATADLTLALILTTTRRTGEGERLLRAGAFTGWTPTFLLGTALQGKQLGLVGFGRIGQAVAARAEAFGMSVAYARRGDGPPPGYVGGAHAMGLDALLRTSHIVSLHVPLTAETKHLIDSAALERMRPDAHVINTARGPVVDELALARALRAGQIAGAALDVYEHEPHVPAALLEAPRAVLLPHLGSNTAEARVAMGQLAARNVAAVLRGETPPAVVVEGRREVLR
jgi:glyoxylate reductase